DCTLGLPHLGHVILLHQTSIVNSSKSYCCTRLTLSKGNHILVNLVLISGNLFEDPCASIAIIAIISIRNRDCHVRRELITHLFELSLDNRDLSSLDYFLDSLLYDRRLSCCSHNLVSFLF